MARTLKLAIPLLFVTWLLSGCPGKKPVTPGANAPVTPTSATHPAAGTASGTVKIFVPCGLTIPIREAAAAYETAHPGTKIDGKFDNAITLALAIRDDGKRPDVYISPGACELGLDEQAGLIDSATKTAIGEFDLVAIVPKANPKNIHTLQDLTKADVVTCPDPAHNSVGMYAKQALQKAGLWDKLMPKGDEKIVFTEKAISSHEKVAAGQADVGLAFRNCPLETNPEKLKKSSVSIAFEFDRSLYDRPYCYAAVVKGGPNPEGAKAFIAFLVQPDTQKLMAANGMQTVSTPPPATGTLPTAAAPAPATAGSVVKVEAYYPDNTDHAKIKKTMQDLSTRYGGRVKGEFIDFTSDRGYQRWKAAGLNCGALLVNGKQTFTVERNGQPKEITFMMAEGGEWTWADLDYVINQALKGSAAKSPTKSG